MLKLLSVWPSRFHFSSANFFEYGEILGLSFISESYLSSVEITSFLVFLTGVLSFGVTYFFLVGVLEFLGYLFCLISSTWMDCS